VDHYERHGPDFKSTSPDDYAARAWTFLQQAKANAWPMKLDDSDGTLRVWNGQTGSFAAYDRNGKTKTYFKPGSPTYWQRQPGSPIKPSQLPFK
jgi:pyocin large subunit-like protein